MHSTGAVTHLNCHQAFTIDSNRHAKWLKTAKYRPVQA
jgi:hypothetical protein